MTVWSHAFIGAIEPRDQHHGYELRRGAALEMPAHFEAIEPAHVTSSSTRSGGSSATDCNAASPLEAVTTSYPRRTICLRNISTFHPGAGARERTNAARA
jgi:hypothetical protein